MTHENQTLSNSLIFTILLGALISFVSLSTEAKKNSFSSTPGPLSYSGFEYWGDGNWRDNGWSGSTDPLDSTTKFYGESSLRIPGGGNNSASNVYFDIPVQPGKNYTFRGYVKTKDVKQEAWIKVTATSRSQQKNLGTMPTDGKASFKGTSEWQLFSLKVSQFPAGTEGVVLSVGIDGPGTAWFDEISFGEQGFTVPLGGPRLPPVPLITKYSSEEGKPIPCVKRVKTPGLMSLGIRTSAIAFNIFDPKEPIKITTVIRNTTNQPRNVTVEYRVNDFEGHVLLQGTLPAQVPAKRETTMDARLDEKFLPQEEYLELKAKLVGEGMEYDSASFGLGILPRRKPVGSSEGSHFGLLAGWHESVSGPGWYRFFLAQRLGARWDRPGPDRTEHRNLVAKLYGIEPILLFMGDPEIGAIGMDSVLTETSTVEEFAQFVGKKVTEYKGIVKYYQIGNEPNVRVKGGPERVVAILKAAYEAAKKADPDCKIVAPGIHVLELKPEAWSDLLRAGMGKYCDIYDYHFYCTVADMDRLLTFVNEQNERFNAVKPQFVTETSVDYTGAPWKTSEALKGAHVIKRYALALSQKVWVPFWFCLWWPAGYGADTPDAAATGAGLLEPKTGSPLPAVFTFAAMTRELEGAEFTKRLDWGKDVYAVQFDHKSHTNLVLWCDAGDRTLSFQAQDGPVAITEISGRKTVGHTWCGRFTVTAGTFPTILALPRGEVKLVQGPALLEFADKEARVPVNGQTTVGVVVSNPTDRVIAGRVVVKGPGTVRIAEGSVHVSLKPGESMKVPFTVTATPTWSRSPEEFLKAMLLCDSQPVSFVLSPVHMHEQ